MQKLQSGSTSWQFFDAPSWKHYKLKYQRFTTQKQNEKYFTLY